MNTELQSSAIQILNENSDIYAPVAEALPKTSVRDYFFALKPTRNQLLFDIFLMQLKAACCAHRKALVCPHYFKTHEDAIETIPAVEALMQEIDEIRKEHIRLLDATGRAINRDALNARYDTIIDKMRIFTRYCRFSTRFDYTKHY